MSTLKNPSATFSQRPTPYSTLDFLSIAISCPSMSSTSQPNWSPHCSVHILSRFLPPHHACPSSLSKPQPSPSLIWPPSTLLSSFPLLTSMTAQSLPVSQTGCFLSQPPPSGLLPQYLPLDEQDPFTGFESQLHRALRPWLMM